jgi:hypothetical protein
MYSCSVFYIRCAIEISAFRKKILGFIFTHIIEFALKVGLYVYIPRTFNCGLIARRYSKFHRCSEVMESTVLISASKKCPITTSSEPQQFTSHAYTEQHGQMIVAPVFVFKMFRIQVSARRTASFIKIFWFSSVPSGKCRDITSITTGPPSSVSATIHYSLSILTCGSVITVHE